MPIAPALRDVLADNLIPARAIPVADTGVAAQEVLFFGGGRVGEETSREGEDVGGESGGDVVVGEVEEAVGGAGGGEGVGAGGAEGGGGVRV